MLTADKWRPVVERRSNAEWRCLGSRSRLRLHLNAPPHLVPIGNRIAQSQILNRTPICKMQLQSRKYRMLAGNKPRIITLSHRPTNDYYDQEPDEQPFALLRGHLVMRGVV